MLVLLIVYLIFLLQVIEEEISLTNIWGARYKDLSFQGFYLEILLSRGTKE